MTTEHTKLGVMINPRDDCSELQNDPPTIKSWVDINEVRFSISKHEVIDFGRINQQKYKGQATINIALLKILLLRVIVGPSS